MIHVRALTLSAMTVLTVTACGGAPVTDSGTESVTRALQQDVLAVTRAAGARDLAAATAALTRLHKDVSSAQRAGLVAPARATRIEASAARVTADLLALSPPVSRSAKPPVRSTTTVRPGSGTDKMHPGKGSGGNGGGGNGGKRGNGGGGGGGDD